jgi:hypothetical protein
MIGQQAMLEREEFMLDFVMREHKTQDIDSSIQALARYLSNPLTNPFPGVPFLDDDIEVLDLHANLIVVNSAGRQRVKYVCVEDPELTGNTKPYLRVYKSDVAEAEPYNATHWNTDIEFSSVHSDVALDPIVGISEYAVFHETLSFACISPNYYLGGQYFGGVTPHVGRESIWYYQAGWKFRSTGYLTGATNIGLPESYLPNVSGFRVSRTVSSFLDPECLNLVPVKTGASLMLAYLSGRRAWQPRRPRLIITCPGNSTFVVSARTIFLIRRPYAWPLPDKTSDSTCVQERDTLFRAYNILNHRLL